MGIIDIERKKNKEIKNYLYYIELDYIEMEEKGEICKRIEKLCSFKDSINLIDKWIRNGGQIRIYRATELINEEFSNFKKEAIEFIQNKKNEKLQKDLGKIRGLMEENNLNLKKLSKWGF